MASGTPVTHSTGNAVYNCTITNCNEAREGNLNAIGQSGLLIHNNTFTNTQRALGHDATHITFGSGIGYNKGVKIYDNVFTLDEQAFDTDGTTPVWNFHIEAWNCQGGYEVYGNTFNGGHVGIDAGGSFNIKGDYDYSWDIHDNTFQWTSNYADELTGVFCGVVFEGSVADLIIRKNHFKNLPNGIRSSMLQESLVHENIYIYYNLFDNIGWGNDAWDFGMWFGQGHATAISRYFYIYNNVINSVSTGLSAGITLSSSNSLTYFEIKNNIIVGASSYGCIAFWDWSSGHTIDNIDIQYNNFYNNASGNDFYEYGSTSVTNLTDANNIETDPVFVGGSPYNYHLQAGSPCINAGIDVGLTTDYDGNLVPYPTGTNPDIGAYEYGSDIMALNNPIILNFGII